MAMPTRQISTLLVPSRRVQRSVSIGSNQTSPSNQSNIGSAEHHLTISSLRGSYVYLVVQVTRDFHPVVYAEWMLPQPGFDLRVADVSLAQFEALASKLGRNFDGTVDISTQGWNTSISRSMISLVQLMKVGQCEYRLLRMVISRYRFYR
jgi:CDK inhibitor PHO81